MQNYITIKGAREHNLKNIDLQIPKDKLVVITGISGSGKSTLAFDTVYAEGQRRYVESLSPYARQFLQTHNKPDVDSIDGLSPAIAIDQKTTSKNPRSTVATVTEIYDYLRLLYARIGVPYSPVTGKPIVSQTVTQMVDTVLSYPAGIKLYIMAPLFRGVKGEHKKELLSLSRQGFQRVKIDGIFYELDDLPKLDKNQKHFISLVIDRLVTGEDIQNRLTDSFETALKNGDGLAEIEFASACQIGEKEFEEGESIIFSEKFACPESGFELTEIEPRIFSFNSPFGACNFCEGLGVEGYFDPALVIKDEKLSLREGAISAWEDTKLKHQNQILDTLSRQLKFSLDKPYNELDDEIKNILLYGLEENISYSFTDGPRTMEIVTKFTGVIGGLQKRWDSTEVVWQKEDMMRFRSKRKCSHCGGYRLRAESLCVRVNHCNIGQVCEMTIEKSYKWFNELSSSLNETHKQIGEKVIKEIVERLGFLANVGLSYLTLQRESGTLSGGESQRIRLASQIGSGLCGVLYVLDEPSIGLHQRDNQKLILTLKKLRDLGNSVIVVEHDEETMLEADYIIDVGPGAGSYGGHIVAAGTLQEIKDHPTSLTGMYLSGRKSIKIPSKLREGHVGKSIELVGASGNNLKNVTASFPLGKLICVTGVSGSGKSTLILQTLLKAAQIKIDGKKTTSAPYEKISGLEYIDNIIDIDQSPIGRTPRSNPATYSGAFNYIRDWFASLPESQSRGYNIGRFSFNVKGGRCEACQGDGMIKIEMHFLPDVYIICDECKGKRYNRATQEVKYKGKSIADVLEMTTDESVEFFNNIPQIRDKVKALKEVGLGYIKLGQSATTLSGGEAQRVKLAKELAKKSTGRTLYILDEPTTGLHNEDISKLLEVIHALVDKGNTAVVIEHNLDVIRTADYVIDIGPEGGDKGGSLVFAGTPRELSKCKASYTGQFLVPHFS
jgi:excinuclease ABC subunit A